MSARGRPVNYTAVTLTVCVLVAVSFMSQCGRKHIPLPPPNELVVYKATDFLYRARFQPIIWHTTDMAPFNWESLDQGTLDLESLSLSESDKESLGLEQLSDGSLDRALPDRDSLDWRLLPREPFAKARHYNKPLMLFIGAGWSHSARRFDEAVFGSRELALRLNNDFVSVRIDLTTEPEWRGALLPISSAQGAIDPGFTIWFLQPNGEIITAVRRTDWGNRDEYSEFLATLDFVSFVHEIKWDSLDPEEKEEFRDETTWLWNAKTERADRLAVMQSRRQAQIDDLEDLIGSSSDSRAPDIDRFTAAVDPLPYRGTLDNYDVAFISPFETWTAAQFRVLLQAGNITAASDLLLGKLLASRQYDVRVDRESKSVTEEFAPKVDLVDGGFFWLGSRTGERSLEFGKLATDQAEMAAVLAHLWRATGVELYRYYCRRALESLLGRKVLVYDKDSSQIVTELADAQFLIDGGPWPSFIDVLTMPNDQSARHSFSNARLRTEFDLYDYSNYSKIGLDSKNNSQMVPFITGLDTLAKEKELLDGFVKKAQEIGDERAQQQGKDSELDDRDLRPGGMDQLDSAATTIARALEAVRMLGDDELLAVLLKRSERLESYRAGPDEVRHTLDIYRLGGTDMWLGDFTAYSDAMMEVYLATGDESKLLVGKRVLERALLVFGTEDDSVFVAASGQRPDMGALSLYVPSIVDDGQPPALPALVRLAFRYGAVTGDDALRKIATGVWVKYSKLANEHPASFSSFIAASQEAMLTGCIVVAGEDRVAEARRLSIDRPGQFVAPALQGVYSPGRFLVVQSSVTRTATDRMDLSRSPS